MIDFLMLASGLLLLFYGGDWLVHSSVAIGRRIGLSVLLVSVVIVGFGTSIPELLVSLQAALKGSSDIALGNVVGSNIANILLILGVGAVIRAIPCGTKEVRQEAAAVMLASFILAALSFFGTIGSPTGLIFLAILTGYIWFRVYSSRTDNIVLPEEDYGDFKKILIKAIASLILLVCGARLLVSAAINIAHDFGLPEAVIGLTVVAIGTSLPELAATVAAARRRETDVIVGNILGSNLFNILGILGITALITPITYSGQIAQVDVWIMLAVALTLVLPVFVMSRVSRAGGIAYLVAYGLYMGWLAMLG